MASGTEDLATIRGVHQYLLRKDLVHPSLRQSAITRLTGGVANFIYHVELPPKAPHRLSATTEGRPIYTVILKYSAPFVAFMPSIQFDISRWDYEILALREFKKFVTQDYYNRSFELVESKVVDIANALSVSIRTPQVYFTDDEKKVIYMEDVSPRAITLKDLLRKPDIDKFLNLNIARVIGKSLAHFLFKLHSWGRGMNQDHAKRVDQFSNKATRKFAAWRIFGRLLETCEKYIDNTDPQSDEKKKTWKQIQETMINMIMTDNATVIMGDFWTGNVLVDLHHYEQALTAGRFVPGMFEIYIVDWEFIRPGNPSADIAQMMGEMHCSERFAKSEEGKQIVKTLGEAFLIEYIRVGGPIDMGAMMVQEGAHVATFTEKAGWSDDKLKVMSVSMEGLKRMERGWQKMQSVAGSA